MGYFCEASMCWTDFRKMKKPDIWPCMRNVSWVKFPIDSDARSMWKKLLRRKDHFKLSRSSRICSRHFDPDQLVASGFATGVPKYFYWNNYGSVLNQEKLKEDLSSHSPPPDTSGNSANDTPTVSRALHPCLADHNYSLPAWESPAPVPVPKPRARPIARPMPWARGRPISIPRGRPRPNSTAKPVVFDGTYTRRKRHLLDKAKAKFGHGRSRSRSSAVDKMDLDLHVGAEVAVTSHQNQCCFKMSLVGSMSALQETGTELTAHVYDHDYLSTNWQPMTSTAAQTDPTCQGINELEKLSSAEAPP